MTTWESLLDGFEADLGREPGDALGRWREPAEPLPAVLAVRARDLLRRQEQRIQRLRTELATVAEHLEAVRRIPEPASDAPAYLDVAG